MEEQENFIFLKKNIIFWKMKIGDMINGLNSFWGKMFQIFTILKLLQSSMH